MNATHQAASPETTSPTQVPHRGNGQHGAKRMDGMVEMARENERFHLAPAPGAVLPVPEPFPRPVLVGLWLGAIVGGLLGFGFARLLLNGTIAIPGWEQLYSMSPGTFSTFWLGMGIALGILVSGVGTILFARPSPTEGEVEPSGDGLPTGHPDRDPGQPPRQRRRQ